MIDAEGYRANVGIVITNGKGQVFWARRYGQHSWQYPQGGVDEGETTEQTMFRELHEEVGLKPHQVIPKTCNALLNIARAVTMKKMQKNFVEQ